MAPDVPNDDDDANVPNWSASGGHRPARPDEDGADQPPGYCAPEAGVSQTSLRHNVQLPPSGDGPEVSSGREELSISNYCVKIS